jgi:hypothetical protein
MIRWEKLLADLVIVPLLTGAFQMIVQVLSVK